MSSTPEAAGAASSRAGSITYTTLMRYEQGREIEVPSSTADGRARQYPIEFDLSGVNPDLRVVPEQLTVSLHARARAAERPPDRAGVAHAAARGADGQCRRPHGRQAAHRLLRLRDHSQGAVRHADHGTGLQARQRLRQGVSRAARSGRSRISCRSTRSEAFRSRASGSCRCTTATRRRITAGSARPSLEYSALGDTYSDVTASANTPLDRHVDAAVRARRGAHGTRGLSRLFARPGDVVRAERRQVLRRGHVRIQAGHDRHRRRRAGAEGREHHRSHPLQWIRGAARRHADQAHRQGVHVRARRRRDGRLLRSRHHAGEPRRRRRRRSPWISCPKAARRS